MSFYNHLYWGCEMTKEFFVGNRRLKKRTGDILLMIGIMPNLDGYKYIIKGVTDCVSDPSLFGRMTKGLYPQIAVAFGKTTQQVERGIRHAIQTGFNRGQFIKLNEIFRVHVINPKDKNKPPNGEFMALLTERLLFEFADELHIGSVLVF